MKIPPFSKTIQNNITHSKTMKMHLPHGLRAALMAAIATVSITSAYGASSIAPGTNWAITWPPKPTPDLTVNLTGTRGQDYSLNNPGKYTKVTGVSVETAWGSNFYAASANSSTTAPTYVDVVNTIFKYGVRGVAGNTTVGGDLYVRLYGGTVWSDAAVLCTEWNTTVKGNLYMELDRWNLTYRGDGNTALGMRHSVLGVWGSNLEKKNTIVIKSGTFEGAVTSGICYANSPGNAIKGGSYLQIEGGTFSGAVVAGNTNITSGTATIENGTHLLIKGGTFKSEVTGGNASTSATAQNTISGGVSMRIEGGDFSSKVFGGSIGTAGSTNKGKITDGINLDIAGGNFTSAGIYALGYTGTVSGNIDLTIGGDATFGQGYIISAGSLSGGVTYNQGTSTSTVTLNGLTGTSSLAQDSTIKVMGGQQTSALVMNNVDAAIKAQLSQFSAMKVTNGSDLTLDSTNAELGGVRSVSVDGGSSLNLSGTRADNVTMTVAADSTLNITDGTMSNATISGDVSIFGSTTLSGNITLEGLVQNGGTLSLVNGTTVNIDEKTLAHDAHFVEGDKQTDNGFLAKESVCLAHGGAYNLGSGVNVTLDGETIADMALTTKEVEGTMELHVSGFDEKEANTYFVNKGDVTYSHIQEVAEQMGRTVNTIEVVSKLVSDVNIDNSIRNLMGDGTLSKTGTGKLTISGDASAFNGEVQVDAGTLEIGKSVTLSAAKGATIGTNGVLLNDGVIGGELAVSGTLKGSGTMATTTIEEAGQLIVGNSPGKQTYTGDLTVEGAVDFSVDDLFGVPATAETSGWGNGTHSVIDMDGHSIFLNGAVTLTLGTIAAGQVDGEGIFELVLVQNIGNAAEYTVEKLTDLYSATAFTDMDGVVVSSSSPLLSQAHYEMKGNDLVLTNTPTTPEPATATLSLLALAGLASRRKRK